MKHAREDYNRIQDPAGLIPEGEPVFLLRAKDVNAPAVVMVWARYAEECGVDPAMVEAARRQSLLMLAWQSDHGSQIPDAPADAVLAIGRKP